MCRVSKIFLAIAAILGFGLQSRAADRIDDPKKLLENWAEFEAKSIPDQPGKTFKDDPLYDEVRARYTKKLARYVFEYVSSFNAIKDIRKRNDENYNKAENILGELKRLCLEIRDSESEIPYLRNKKLTSFAKEFLDWEANYKVKVTVRIKPIKEDKECHHVTVYTSELKNVKDKVWQSYNAKDGSDDSEIEMYTYVHHPWEGVECNFGIMSFYQRHIVGWKKLKPIICGTSNHSGKKYIYFAPAKDAEISNEYVPSICRGASYNYTFTAVSEAGNNFPVRLADFLRQYGRIPDDLCKEDND